MTHAMTSTQYREILGHAGLSKNGAARLFGVNEVTSRRWASKGITGTAAMILRLLANGDVSQEAIAAARDYCRKMSGG
jgi:hypothetical protein